MEKKDKKIKSEAMNKMEIFVYLAIIVAILLFKKFVATPILVSGASMKNTLLDSDILILNKMAYVANDIKRFDIVVVDTDSEYIIKRVVGLPGEKISYIDNKLYVNKKLVKENYQHGQTENFEVTVPKNKYFVLGDNREVSVDSRMLGAFSKKEILGKTNLVIFPFKRFGIKK